MEKRAELGEQVTKLRNGLFKIDDTRSNVEAMSVELEEAKAKVADFQKQCEEYLVVIVQQKRETDEQQKVRATRLGWSCTNQTCTSHRDTLPLSAFKNTSRNLGSWK